LNGKLKPAEHLPEVTLAAELKVSRNTIRKALLKLESDNLIVIEDNKRARVRCFTLEEVLQYLEVRELLDCFILRQCFPLLGNAELEEMRNILSDVKRYLDEHEILKCHEHILLYYNVLYRICPNRPAVEMILMLRNQLKRFNLKTLLIPGRGEESFNEHKGVLAALEQGELDTAEKLMHVHLSNIREVVQKHFEFFL
jgi:DNA-binding GntR family transcriptional regulator